MDIPVGQPIRRAEIHARYGGSSQSGIAPSKQSPNVLLFTNPKKGKKYGYTDGLAEDGCYHYSGEGQEGDQVMTRGNKAVLMHAEEGRALHLFETLESGEVIRVGEFVLDPETAWYSTDGPDVNGEIRRLIVFRLRPVGETVPLGPVTRHSLPEKMTVEYVPIEKHNTERSIIQPGTEERVSERREAPLVQSYRTYLEDQGIQVTRTKIKPAGELKPLFTDLYNVTTNQLIEAKGSVTREAIRMAIGQLFDYKRHITPTPSLAVLLPERPRPDLLQLCAEYDISTIWPRGEEFEVYQPPGTDAIRV